MTSVVPIIVFSEHKSTTASPMSSSAAVPSHKAALDCQGRKNSGTLVSDKRCNEEPQTITTVARLLLGMGTSPLGIRKQECS